MTDDYKLKLLNYILGKVEETPSNDDEIIKEIENIPSSEWRNFFPDWWENIKIEGIVQTNQEYSSIGVMYGGYILKDNVGVRGFIVLFDDDFKPIKTIYEYDSGTPLRYIQYMKQAEDGTFYFIDDVNFPYKQQQSNITSQKRFVMVNNFTLKNEISDDYTVNLRTSYVVPSQYTNFYCKNMYKDPNSANYIFFGSSLRMNITGLYSWRDIKIWGLTVNVGQSNEYREYASIQNRLYGSAIATFNENNEVQYRCICSNTLNTSRNVLCNSKTYTSNNQETNISTFNYQPYVDDITFKKQSEFLNYNQVYLVQNNQGWGVSGTNQSKYIGLYKYDFTTQKTTTIFEKYLGEYDYSYKEYIYIDRCDTDIYVQYINNYDRTNYKADYYYQRLVNDKWQPILIGTDKPCIWNQRTIATKSNYNLFQFYSYATNPRPTSWEQYSIKENYNALNYNGIPYNAYNSLIPKQAELYQNEKLVFARNLYNIQAYNSSTSSTLQIPNIYLNNVPISKKSLLSLTNSTLLDDNITFNKNLYENVFINFINTLSCIDEDTNILYPNTANYVNSNINIGTLLNNHNTKLSKIRYNFEDGIVVKPIAWVDISTSTKPIYKTVFSFYVSSNLTSIDFISEDETQVYCSKQLDVEVDNYYTMEQKIRID